MKNKFIRCLSPITFFVILLLDGGIILFGYYSVTSIMEEQNVWTILFIVIEIFSLIIGILVTRQIFTNGVRFTESQVEFTGLDDNNIFKYSDIDRIESLRDTKASLKKNFVDRYSHLVIYLKDGSSVTIDLGLTTKRTLKNINDTLNEYIKKRD